MNQEEIIIIGSNGQLGMALKEKYPLATAVDYKELDITNLKQIESFYWSKFKIILNAAAYTNVDGAETKEGRINSWEINGIGPANLAKVSSQYDLTLVHISTDYVFDGTSKIHDENEPFSPLSVYGASKAAGDIAVSQIKKNYILRTSWVIGDGNNFVRTMMNLGLKGVNPTVVSDQIGKLTFTSELVRAIDFLIINNSPYGTYNLTNEGEKASWARITKIIFELMHIKNIVIEITTDAYYKGKDGIAPRPLNSVLSLDKIHSTGFKSKEWKQELKKYIDKEISK
jgi:dTDP-4-dehydrorhamnose 3,5-epimerase